MKDVAALVVILGAVVMIAVSLLGRSVNNPEYVRESLLYRFHDAQLEVTCWTSWRFGPNLSCLPDSELADPLWWEGKEE